MPNLPKDRNKPFTVSSLRFANRKEYDERVKQDAEVMAQLLYDIYQNKKRKKHEEVVQFDLPYQGQ
jgi:hypothetical protein